MKVKRSILLVVFLGGALLCSAQTKHEYMTIIFSMYSYKIGVSIDGKEFLNEKVEVPKPEKNYLNTNPLLQKVTMYEDQGWELMNMECVYVTEIGTGAKEFIAYLRKKRTDQK